MKKNLLALFVCFIFSTLTLQATIFHTDFGNGWVIQMDENAPVDIDQDGIVDFYINQYEGELGFTPIFGQGCFSGTGEFNFVSFGARELRTYEAGETMDINMGDLYDYIEDGRGSAFHKDDGFAEGWNDMEEVYVSFFIFATGRNGWIKIKINEEDQDLIIKEWAYENYPHLPIIAGDQGENTTVAVNDLKQALGGVAISPNPADQFFKMNFNYTGDEKMDIVIFNSVGKLVQNIQLNVDNGTYSLRVPTASLTNGLYFIRFQSPKGIRSEKLLISR